MEKLNLRILKKLILKEMEQLCPECWSPMEEGSCASCSVQEDHEVFMAHSSLESIIKSATELLNKIGDSEKDLPAWIQDHITNSENYINQANKGYYEESEEEQPYDEEIVAYEQKMSSMNAILNEIKRKRRSK